MNQYNKVNGALSGCSGLEFSSHSSILLDSCAIHDAVCLVIMIQIHTCILHEWMLGFSSGSCRETRPRYKTRAVSEIFLWCLWDLKRDLQMWSDGLDSERWVFDRAISDEGLQRQQRQTINTETIKQTNRKASCGWKRRRNEQIKGGGRAVRCEETREVEMEGRMESEEESEGGRLLF